MVNPPNTTNPSKKVRAFSVMTYCTKQQIAEVLGSHNSSIRAYAYIHHDKDEAEPHYHVVFRTFDAWSIPQIEKWWKGFTDEKGEPTNTFVQRATDLHALHEYLTHSDAESKDQGKHQYSPSDIISNGLFDLVPKKDAVDDTYEMLEHMMNGASTKWMVRRYGRAFVYHYSQFIAVKEAMQQDEWMAESRRQSIAQGYKVPDLKPIPLDDIDIDEVLK